MAKYDELKITLTELFNGYEDDGDGGVFAYEHNLIVRPAYQREFVYSDKKRDAVINTITKGLPLGIIWWALNDDGTYELLDGQQRTLSICKYMNGDFGIDNIYYTNLLSGSTKNTIDNYELTIYIFKGTAEEKLEWFKTINIANEVLTDQELLNATYTGKWLSDAKRYFSKRDCVAKKIADGYMKGNPIRQDYLESALKWIANRDNLKGGIAGYMAIHQHDENATELWEYYKTVIDWAKNLIEIKPKITDYQEWGILYNNYKDKSFDKTEFAEDVKTYIRDDDVSKKSGIIPYLLSNKDIKKEKLLSIRSFTESQKLKIYEEQNHKCKKCGKECSFEEMHGDHKIAWSKGGHTTIDNLQMLCVDCNLEKGDD